MRRKTVSLAAILALAILTAACASRKAPPVPPAPVTVASVGTQATAANVKYSGSLVPFSQTTLSFKSGGYIAEILQVRGSDGRMRDVQEGDYVKKGTVLAQVRTEEYKAGVQRAQAQLEGAKASAEKAKLNFDRASALYATKSIVKPDYDSAKAALEESQASVSSAQGALIEAQVALHDCTLVAPSSGWMLSRNVEKGSFVGTGTAGFTIADTHLVKVVFGVPDTVVGQVRLGQHQVISIEALADTFDGTITAVSQQADQQTRLFQVEVTMANRNDELRAGMIASLTLNGQKLAQNLLVVPLSAIAAPRGSSGGFGVFVLESNGTQDVARWRAVKLGPQFGDRVSVEEGLSLGERVVSNGASHLRDGEQVQVVP